MHLHLTELLSLRDSRIAASEGAEHLRQCAVCSAELNRLRSMQDRLRNLPALDAPDDSWSRIQGALQQDDAMAATRVHAARNRRRSHGAIAAIAASLCVFVLVVILSLRDSGPPPLVGTQAPPTNALAANTLGGDPKLATLIEQSRELDALLQELPNRPSVERVAMAATLDSIEQRVQWLDFQLSYAAESKLSETQAQRLWRERIELMDSLVKVRYAQTGHVSF